ncbi:hypothetical protein [Mycobacterium sp. 48b]|uniref:hypothetical protein n=1 Tax=Mycobacterium sp. 48b TaxID=3400426 RepID=UPI003AAB0B1E
MVVAISNGSVCPDPGVVLIDQPALRVQVFIELACWDIGEVLLPEVGEVNTVPGLDRAAVALLNFQLLLSLIRADTLSPGDGDGLRRATIRGFERTKRIGQDV